MQAKIDCNYNFKTKVCSIDKIFNSTDKKGKHELIKLYKNSGKAIDKIIMDPVSGYVYVIGFDNNIYRTKERYRGEHDFSKRFSKMNRLIRLLYTNNYMKNECLKQIIHSMNNGIYDFKCLDRLYMFSSNRKTLGEDINLFYDSVIKN